MKEINIYTAQTKHNNLKHWAEEICTGMKVMKKNMKQKQKKGNKHVSQKLGPYTIVKVCTNGNYTIAEQIILAAKVCASQVKQ